MLKHIQRFFAFLFPIVRTAAMQVAADEITRRAYPARRTARTFNNHQYVGIESHLGPIAHYSMSRDGKVRDNTKVGPNPFYQPDPQGVRVAPGSGFHDVLMVAFDLSGNNAQEVHEWLHAQLPAGDESYGDIHLDAWWVANDERFDGSDCDSAVFVTKGNQKAARKLLRAHGLLN